MPKAESGIFKPARFTVRKIPSDFPRRDLGQSLPPITTLPPGLTTKINKSISENIPKHLRNRMITFIFVTNQLLKIMRRDVFQAIADPVRRDIITLLAEQSLTVNSVAEKFDVSRPAISKHLKILKECGIIAIHKQGRERFCQIQPRNLIPAFLWLDQYRNLWEDKLDSFENYLTQLQTRLPDEQAKNKKDE